MLRNDTAATLLVIAGCISQCATAQTPSRGCDAPEHRQFDFWIGHWDVFGADGKLAGENLIEPIAGGCALLESWRGAGGFSGKSLNSWDRHARRWRQHWVDSGGALLRLEGALEGHHMVLAGRGPHPRQPDTTVHDRITWTPNDDGSVRQHWERSEDGGGSWRTVFDGRYVKRR